MARLTLFLVHCPDDAVTELEPQFEFAHAMQAHLELLVLAASAAVPSVMIADTCHYDWSRMYQQMNDHAVQRREELETLLGRRAIEATVTTTCQPWNQVSETVAQRSLYADMMVMGAVSPQSAMSAPVFNGALFSAGQSVLILPGRRPISTPLERVMIAWDHGPQAARAVRASLPLLARSQSVQIVSVRSDARLPEVVEQRSAHRLQHFLQRHDIRAETSMHTATHGVSTTIDHLVDTWRADLLVMGAYGHSRLREWILGGTTRFLLENCSAPLLMAH